MTSGDSEPAELEPAFERYHLDLIHDRVRVMTILVGAVLPGFYILDLLTLQGSGLLPRLAIYRGSALLFFAAQYILVRRTAPSRWSLVHAHAIVIVVSLTICVVLVHLGAFEANSTSPFAARAPANFAGLLLVVGSLGLFPWRSKDTLVTGMEVLAIYIGFNLLFGGRSPTTGVFYLVAMLAIALALTELRFRSTRDEFRARHELDAAKQRIARDAEELSDQHDELKRQHAALQRSKEALVASYQQADRLFAAMIQALPGSVLEDRYRLKGELGSGGFGVIYEGVQIHLQRPVAVKIFRPPSRESREVLYERFRREGLSTCRVDHPNAVGVIDTGVTKGGLPFIVMERLLGGTVRERLRDEGPFTLGRTLAILGDVCSVLSTAHKAGIIHRDIKPSNVFLHRPEHVDSRAEVVKVLDFGIAKLTNDPERLTVTRTGQLIGTPTHMAPERLSGGEVTGRSDVYSVAVMLYEMLTGELPFAPLSTSDVWSTLWMQVTVMPEPLDAIDPSIPPAVSELALRGLAKEAAERPTATQMEAELRRILSTLEPAELDKAMARRSGAAVAVPSDVTTRWRSRPGLDADTVDADTVAVELDDDTLDVRLDEPSD